MKKKVFSKSMAWILSVVMVFGVFFLYGTETLTASAMTMDQFNARLSELQQKYPTGYVWKDKYYGKYELSNEYINWVQCKGFAHLMGYEVFGTDPGTWPVDYNFSHLEPGDIIQFGDPNINGGNHSVFCTSVSGDTYYFVDCNGNGNRDENGKYKAGLCMVLWGDKGYISKGSLYNGMHNFSYLIKSPIKPPPPPDPITYDYMPVGEKYYLKNNGTGTYMSVDYGVDKQLQNISVYQLTKEAGQQYEIVGSDTDRSYFLSPVLCQSSGRVVNVNGEYTSAGANIMLYNYTGHSTQQWKFRPVSGGYEICSTNNTNYCLAESGTNVQMATYTGASNQIWTLEPVEHHHDYTEYVYNWAAHPHYKCYRCSCGEVMENRNEPTYVDTCPDCIVEARADVGTDFYAYIINTYPWKMASVVVDDYSSVRLYGETALSNQFWYFERQSDRSYKITNVATGKLLDVSAGAADNGTDVCVWSDYNGDNQRWYLVEVNGNYVLHPKHAPAMALDVNGGYTDDGTNIQIWTTNNSAAQIFTIYRYGNLPDRPELTLRGNVFEGENVTISWNACSFAHHYQISVWHNGKEEQSFTSQNLSYTFENVSAGDYGICVTAVNQNGSSNVATYDFTVPNYTISPAATGNYSRHTYEYYDTKLTWNQAYKFCEKKGGHLVTINSQGENDFLAGFTSGKVNKSWINAWTGGRTFDAETWFWITGETFEYMNWNDGEPNNTDNAEDAVNIILTSDLSYNGKWNDMNSSNLSSIDGFICEYEDVDASNYTPVYKENYNGHEYWFFENAVDWQTAKKVCVAKGGYLAIPNNADENSFILSGVQKTAKEEAWIGITDIEREGLWKDVKGNSISYSNWANEEPSNYLGIEDYGVMCSTGKWNDLRGFGASYRSVGFVCEFDDLCTGSGHDYKLTSEKPATCTTDGEKIYTCSRCGDTKTEVVKATGHNYTTKVIAPTCTEQGYTLHTCTNCGDSYKDTYTDPTGHKYTEKVIAPTVDEKGYTLHTCSVCGHSYKDNYTNKLLVNKTTLAAENVKLGSYITINASAAGGTGKYTYAVWYKRASASSWTTKQKYSTNAEIKIKPAAAVKYNISVKVKDSSGKIVKKAFTVNVFEALKNTSTVPANVAYGSSINIKASAKGGLGTYQYEVFYKQASSSKWTKKQSYSTNNKISFKPKAATTYDISVKVKDSRNVVVKKRFKVSVTKPTNTSKVAATSIKLGSKIQLTCSAKGGTGFYQYAVYYKRASASKWTTKQSYSSNTSVTIKPAAKTTYKVCIRAKDSNGNDSKKYFTITVT